MANDKIMVTVTVPEGLRAVVDMYDDQGTREQMQQVTVTGGQSQEFFVDRVRRISVKEGSPQFITDALDRKPGSE